MSAIIFRNFQEINLGTSQPCISKLWILCSTWPLNMKELTSIMYPIKPKSQASWTPYRDDWVVKEIRHLAVCEDIGYNLISKVDLKFFKPITTHLAKKYIKRQIYTRYVLLHAPFYYCSFVSLTQGTLIVILIGLWNSLRL